MLLLPSGDTSWVLSCARQLTADMGVLAAGLGLLVHRPFGPLPTPSWLVLWLACVP